MTRLLHIFSAACLFAGAQALMGADADELPVRLTGISSIEGSNRALFEVPAKGRRSYFKPVLGEGERVEDLEVKRIDPATGRVHVRHKGIETYYTVDETAAADPNRTLQINAADSRQVLELLQELSGRTVLMEPNLPAGKITLSGITRSRQEAAAVIEESFGKLGIQMQPRAAKFLFVIRTNKLDQLALIPEPPEDPAPQAKNGAPDEADILPAGMVKFQNADMIQFLEIYQELAGSTVLRNERFSAPKITVKTQSELSRAQVIWVFESLLRLSDLTVTKKGSKFVCLTSTNDQSKLEAIAEPPTASKSGDEFPAGMFKFWQADLGQMLDIYQSIRKRTVLRSPGLNAKVTVKSQTVLSRDEAVWMLDTLLALTDIAAVPHGEKFVFIVPDATQPKLPAFTPNPVAENISSKGPLATGALKLVEAESRTALDLYASLCGRKALEPVPASRFTVRNETDLTTAETLYALEATAALNNLKLELVGDHDVRLVAAAEHRRRNRPDPR